MCAAKHFDKCSNTFLGMISLHMKWNQSDWIYLISLPFKKGAGKGGEKKESEPG